MSHRLMQKGLWLVLLFSMSCARYSGPSRATIPIVVDGAGWSRVDGIELVLQRSDGECGQAATAMVLSHWGDPVTLDTLQRELPLTQDGLRAIELRDTLAHHGMRSFVIEGTISDLEHEIAAGRPVIVGTIKRLNNRQGVRHFEVVVAIHKERKLIVTLDPSLGWRKSSYKNFETEWSGAAHTSIVTLPAEGSD
jgi:ABC-type bacteriocin/lantibiotic exporter with double-glycine peptidase domain